jgi:hypothetical protein
LRARIKWVNGYFSTTCENNDMISLKTFMDFLALSFSWRSETPQKYSFTVQTHICSWETNWDPWKTKRKKRNMMTTVMETDGRLKVRDCQVHSLTRQTHGIFLLGFSCYKMGGRALKETPSHMGGIIVSIIERIQTLMQSDSSSQVTSMYLQLSHFLPVKNACHIVAQKMLTLSLSLSLYTSPPISKLKIV